MNKFISVEEKLPIMGLGVLVFGVNEKQTVIHHIYEARRWPKEGVGLGYYEESWEWLTPNNDRIDKVELWAKMPGFPFWAMQGKKYSERNE